MYFVEAPSTMNEMLMANYFLVIVMMHGLNDG